MISTCNNNDNNQHNKKRSSALENGKGIDINQDNNYRITDPQTIIRNMLDDHIDDTQNISIQYTPYLIK